MHKVVLMQVWVLPEDEKEFLYLWAQYVASKVAAQAIVESINVQAELGEAIDEVLKGKEL